MNLRSLTAITLATISGCVAEKEDFTSVLLSTDGMQVIESLSNEDNTLGINSDDIFMKIVSRRITEAKERSIRINGYIMDGRLDDALELCIETEKLLDPSKKYNHEILANTYRQAITIYLMGIHRHGVSHSETQRRISLASHGLDKIGAKYVE
ncbi:MAG: hypothetical protein Q8Q42_02930 [Nanoarchaeota archaeon]|nr:hypothetical protein [Nanoarchaeota archaeon]